MNPPVNRWILSSQDHVALVWSLYLHFPLALDKHPGPEQPVGYNLLDVYDLGGGHVALWVEDFSCYVSMRNDEGYRLQLYTPQGDAVTWIQGDETFRPVPTGDGFFALYNPALDRYVQVDPAQSPSPGNYLYHELHGPPGDLASAARFAALGQERNSIFDLLQIVGSAAGMSFAGIDLGGHVLDDKQLEACDFSAAIGVSACSFRRARLQKAHVTDAALQLAALEGADADGATFDGCSLVGGTSPLPSLTGARLDHCDLRRAQLPGVRLSGAVLTDTSFAGVDLAGADLSAVLANGVDLTGADLRRANLRGASIAGSLRDADLTDADLTDAVLYADMTGANLTGADLTGATLDGNLTGASLVDTNLASVYLDAALNAGLVLHRTDLSGADLTRSHLDGADLSGCLLAGTDFTGQDLTTVTFAPSVRGADTTGAPTVFRDCTIPFRTLGLDWRHLDLTGATIHDLPASDLTGLKADGMHLHRGDFTGYRLDGASFVNATLDHTVFTRATLDHANFHQARLLGAFFTHAKLRSAGFAAAIVGGTTGEAAADFSMAYIDGCDFTDASLYAVSFAGATVVGATTFTTGTTPGLGLADFTNAYLPAARFTGAGLRGATFDGAYLVGGHLEGADLSPAAEGAKAGSLVGTFLQGAHLDGCIVRGCELDDAVLAEQEGSVVEQYWDGSGVLTDPVTKYFDATSGAGSLVFDDDTVCPNGVTYGINRKDGVSFAAMMMSTRGDRTTWSPDRSAAGNAAG